MNMCVYEPGRRVHSLCVDFLMASVVIPESGDHAVCYGNRARVHLSGINIHYLAVVNHEIRRNPVHGCVDQTAERPFFHVFHELPPLRQMKKKSDCSYLLKIVLQFTPARNSILIKRIKILS